MELKAEEKEYSIEYKEFTSDYHVIRARLDEDGENAADRAIQAIKNKKLSGEEKENAISMWVQKHMVVKYTHAIDGEQWQASFEALRKTITGKTTAEAMKEVKKQTTLDQHTGKEKKPKK